MNNREILKKVAYDIGKIKEAYHFSAKDAVIRSAEKTETMLARTAKTEFKKIPMKAIRRGLDIKKIISPEEGHFGVRVAIGRIPIWVWDILPSGVQNHLLKTKGAKFKEHQTKKGNLKIKRTGQKHNQERVSNKINIYIKKKKSLYRTYVFVIGRKLFRRDGYKVNPVMTSASSEILSNEPTQKIFFNEISNFFIKRFLGRLDAKLKGLIK